MGKFATGKRSLAISDRSGQAFPYSEMVKEWNGSLVHISEYEPKHPQLDPPYNVPDAIALRNPRTQKFQQPQTVATGDQTKANSGGITVGVANLTLPGDFAFRVSQTNFTGNGITIAGSSLVPEDPSLQNKRRQVQVLIGKTTVSIS